MNKIYILMKILIFSIFIQSCGNSIEYKYYDKSADFDSLVAVKMNFLKKNDYSELKVLNKVPESLTGDLFSVLSIKDDKVTELKGYSQLIGLISYKTLNLNAYGGQSKIRLILSGIMTDSLNNRKPIVIIYSDYVNVSFVEASGEVTEPNRFIMNYYDNDNEIKYFIK